MRPLMICRQFLPVAHGTEKQAAALARELCAMGHAARIVAGRFEPAWPERETIDGVEIIRLPSPRIRLAGTAIYLNTLRRFLAREAASYDVIHAHFAKHSAALAARMSAELNKPVICKAACAGPFGDLAAARRVFMPRRLLEGLMRVDRLVALSGDVAREWIESGYPSGRIARIPNGVDAERFRPATEAERFAARKRLRLPDDARIVLGVGRLSAQKNFAALLAAVAAVSEATPLHLALAGDGDQRAALQRAAREAGLSERVHFLGAIEDVETAYRAADLFVLPSLGEGMSNALLEAMASGLDAIATRVSGSNELIRHGENGLLADPGSVEALAAALREWAAMERGRLGAEARRTVEGRYALPRVAVQYLALYDEVVAERTNGALNRAAGARGGAA